MNHYDGRDQESGSGSREDEGGWRSPEEGGGGQEAGRNRNTDGRDGSGGGRSPRGKERKGIGWLLGSIGLFLASAWKSIFALLKFSKFGGALLSILITLGVYIRVFKFEMAVGIIAMIFIHEMGHVIAARRRGLPTSAPVFIPFVGALITMKRNPTDAETEAYVAFGGPLWGSVGALLAMGLGVLLGRDSLIAIAQFGFMINLFNLLPIHPLDGGRISTAVTRWLWLVGLILGLVLIIYWFSIILLIIWFLFAKELYQQFIKNKGQGKPQSLNGSFELPVAPLLAQGMIIPGENHRRELAFTTYSDRDGKQHVEFAWDAIGLHGKAALPQQALIRKVTVERILHVPPQAPDKLFVYCRIDYEGYVNDRYYDVPAAVRWKYGLGYGGLAIFLFYMLYMIHGMNLHDRI